MDDYQPSDRWKNCKFKPRLLKRSVTKQYLISAQPKILTINIKRFYQSQYSLQKLGTTISYPKFLDLTPFQTHKENMNIIFRYKLFGVCVHMGNLNNGHYVAYIRNTEIDEKDKIEKDTWWYFSDEDHCIVEEEEVLRQQAYILLYERTELNN